MLSLNRKQKINPKVVLNLMYIVCDTIFSVIIFAIAKKYLLIIIIGAALVVIRALQKLIALYFNYRKKSAPTTPKLPRKNKNLFVVFILIAFAFVAVVTYFFNKNASLSSLVNKIAGGHVLQVLTYIISVWAMISIIVSIYPAIWHIINKIRSKEEASSREYFSEILHKSQLSGLKQEFSCFDHGYFKIIPEKISKTGDLDLNYLTNIESTTEEIKLIQKYDGNEICFFHAIINGKNILIDSEKHQVISCKGSMWYLHSFLQSKKIKLPITILDYLADIPFMFFAIGFSSLPHTISVILTACLPLGLIECWLYNTHYFLREQSISKINNSEYYIAKSSNKGSKIKTTLTRFKFNLFVFVMSAAFVSAASKFFVRFFPVYHASIAAGINYDFSIVFAAIFGTIYMLRNLANMVNVSATIKQKISDMNFNQQLPTSRDFSACQHRAPEDSKSGKQIIGGKQRKL